jgi:hypothetical protein
MSTSMVLKICLYRVSQRFGKVDLLLLCYYFMLYIQSDQQESKSEQALQIIGHVVAKSYAHKRSKHGRRQFMVSNAT